MRTTALICLLLILPWQQLNAQDADPAEAEPEVEVELPPADTRDTEPLQPGEPEVILEPPGSAQQANESSDESQPSDEDQDAVLDVPGRVARLSLIEGDVSIAPAGTEELVEAVLNRPLTSGDRVLVDTGGRAELQLGSATLYLEGGSGLSFVELSDGAVRVSLTEGTAVIRVRRKQQDEVLEVATPNTTIALLRPGDYSIDADPSGTRTTLKTRAGEAELSNERDSFRVRARQQGVFDGTDTLQARITELGERTAFEAFANDRERRDIESRSSNYVSRDVIGYEDLDEHGDWLEEPEYGYVWRPRFVDAGWVPYRHGRWAFIAPWGWTWIDHARWGFAPFHYGRWAYLKSRWCWVPGPRRFRPIYAPALVGWTGRSSFSASVAFGSGIGWFPLAPRELYVPSYRYSRRYVSNLNVSNTIIINNTFVNNIYRSGGRRGWHDGRQSAYLDYRYRNQAGAVTLVERDVFVGGRSIDGRFRKLDARQWRRGRHDGLPPSIDPQRSSRLAGRSVQRTGWQERFSRADRPLRTGGMGGTDGTRANRQVGSGGQRREAWQNRGSQRPPAAVNGLAPERRSLDPRGGARRWQDGGRLQPGSERSGSDYRERRQLNGQGGEPQRWQDRGSQGDQQREPQRWQDRGREQQQGDRPRRSWSQGREQRPERNQPSDQTQQQQPQRWQDRGQRQEQRQEGRQDGQRSGRERGDERQQSQGQQQNNQREARPQRDEGRRGWQQSREQRSSSGRDQSSRGNGGQSRWQRP